MKKILLLLAVCLIALPLYAQKTTRTSNRLKASSLKKVQIEAEDERLRAELKTDKTVLTINCGLFEEIDPKKQYASGRLKAQKENSRVRQMLYEASLAGDKSVRAKMNCMKAENGETQTPFFMIVEKGKVKYMGDYVPDGKGGLKLDSMYCDKLNIGTLAAREPGAGLEFTPLPDNNYADKVLILQCQSGAKSFIF